MFVIATLGFKGQCAMRPTVIGQNFYLLHFRCGVHRLQEAVQLRLLLSASDDFLEDAARARVHGGE